MTDYTCVPAATVLLDVTSNRSDLMQQERKKRKGREREGRVGDERVKVHHGRKTGNGAHNFRSDLRRLKRIELKFQNRKT
jgi:hypothetical protein